MALRFTNVSLPPVPNPYQGEGVQTWTFDQDSNPKDLLNKGISMFLPKYRFWFPCVATMYSPSFKRYRLEYFDGSIEWRQLSGSRFGLIGRAGVHEPTTTLSTFGVFGSPTDGIRKALSPGDFAFFSATGCAYTVSRSMDDVTVLNPWSGTSRKAALNQLQNTYKNFKVDLDGIKNDLVNVQSKLIDVDAKADAGVKLNAQYKLLMEKARKIRGAITSLERGSTWQVKASRQRQLILRKVQPSPTARESKSDSLNYTFQDGKFVQSGAPAGVLKMGSRIAGAWCASSSGGKKPTAFKFGLSKTHLRFNFEILEDEGKYVFTLPQFGYTSLSAILAYSEEEGAFVGTLEDRNTTGQVYTPTPVRVELCDAETKSESLVVRVVYPRNTTVLRNFTASRNTLAKTLRKMVPLPKPNPNNANKRAAVAPPGFSFGRSAMGQQPMNTFQFGAAANPAAKFQFGAAAKPASQFGAANPAAKFQFGATANPAAKIQFGAAANPAAKLQLGGAAKPAVPFQFGATASSSSMAIVSGEGDSKQQSSGSSGAKSSSKTTGG